MKTREMRAEIAYNRWRSEVRMWGRRQLLCLCLSCTAFAQQADKTSTHQMGLALLGQARDAVASLPAYARMRVLDDIALTAFQAGETQMSTELTQEALAGFHAEADRRRNIPARQFGPNSFSIAGPVQSLGGAIMVARRHLAVHDTAGARQWLNAALNSWADITDEREHASAGSRVAELQTDLGDLEGARKTYATAYANSKYPDANVLAGIAARMARDGDTAAAKKMAQGQPDSVAGPILGKIAIQQATNKDFVGALETVQGIKTWYDRVQALAEIGTAEAKSGDKAGASATFATALKLPPSGSGTVHMVAEAEARAGMLEDAMQLLASLPDQGYGIHVADYLQIGKLAAKGNRPEIAKQCFAAALSAIEKKKEPEDTPAGGRPTDWRQTEIRGVIRAEAQAGQFAEALDAAKLLTGRERQLSLMDIASAQARAGDLEAAEQTMDEYPSLRGEVPGLIEVRAQKGDFISAFGGARQSGMPEMEFVFRAYCTPEHLQTCLDAASQLTMPFRKAQAFLGMAENLLGTSLSDLPGTPKR